MGDTIYVILYIIPNTINLKGRKQEEITMTTRGMCSVLQMGCRVLRLILRVGYGMKLPYWDAGCALFYRRDGDIINLTSVDTKCKYHDGKRELLFFVGGKQDTINLKGKIKNEITMTRSGVCSVL